MMTKAIAITILSVCLSFVAGIALAEKVRDVHELRAAHHHIEEAMKELNNARAANHYDMAGHGAKAEEHLKAAEHELHEAIESAQEAK